MSEGRSSGVYIIDSEYNIVGFNKTAEEIYPMLRKNEKCYKVLMNGEKPCAICPVYNNIKGPRTYTDPIRHIEETVDAVEMPLEDGRMGYGLIFSTVPEAPKKSNVTPSKKRTILIVEDNALNRDILHEYLEDEYHILEASDGNEGLNLLNAHYWEISLILLDLEMPNCNGYDFMRRIKGDVLLSSIPIIIMTGDSGQKAEEQCLELGAVDFLKKPYEPIIVKMRIKNIIRMRESAATLSTIETDDLTGLYTRPAFLHHARDFLDTNPEDSFDLMIIDIENFRRINGIFGEEKGDEILKTLADFVREHTSDGLCARFGSDLFAGLKRSEDGDKKCRISELMRQYVAQAPVPNLDLKCGIYQNVDRSLSVDKMYSRAFLALKSIKGNHDRMVALFDGPVSQQLLKAQNYELAFKNAIDQKEFVVYFQPKYNAYTEKIVGVEALVRWKHGGEMISPGEFLPVFEKSGRISQLDEYIFRAVCEYQSDLKKMGKELIPISVNISRVSMHHADVVTRYKNIIEENGISPEDVPIEITESAAVGGKEIKALADAFYEAGFLLHMDDFGAGRSSLNDLNVLHFDAVKFDKSLIDYIGDKDGELLLMYTMALGKELGLHLVAEGVEDKKQLEFLRENGCDVVQGYYYAKPMPIEEYERKYADASGQNAVDM